ncbi:MAG TPA: hypothetical protein VFP89_08250 [Propionibacteriaceae bacterium]|nr:hypothetical protein [Propionibacteriaceae bacterium]
MPRRVSLPGASELFRPTQPVEPAPTSSPGHAIPTPEQRNGGESSGVESSGGESNGGGAEGLATRAPGRGSGRVRHDEKITVYVSSDELVALEQARLTLRAEHGMAVDRGRIVREAISAAIADLARRGADSDLVRRLASP